MGVFQPRRRPRTAPSNGAPHASGASQATPLPPRAPQAASSQLVWVPPQPTAPSQPAVGNGRMNNATHVLQSTQIPPVPPAQIPNTSNVQPPFSQQPTVQQPSISRPQSKTTDLVVGAGQNEVQEIQRAPERNASPYPVDILDTIDRIVKDQRISSQDTSIKLFKLVAFLMRHRGPDAASFADDCLQLYNLKYRKSRAPRGVPAEGQPHSQSRGAEPVAQSAGHDLTGNANTRAGVASSSHAGRGPEIMSISEQVHTRIAVKVKEEPPSPPKMPLPKVTSRMFSGREELAAAAKHRWERFEAGLEKPASPRSEDREHYVIWKNDKESIRLPVDYCRSLTMLHDRNGEVCAVHLDALRFLWQYMVVDSCSGAVFNPTIGYPRTQLVLTFCYLVHRNLIKEPKNIVIFCPSCAVNEWERAASCCRGVPVLFLRLDTWALDAKRFEAEGGVLVCSFDSYLQILRAPQLDQRTAATRVLCRPGPSIAIVDEASRLLTLRPALRRALSSTKTTARLALTNLPWASNVVPFWNVINWAVPDFLGPLEEYLYVFVRNLIIANKHRSVEQEKRKGFALEASLRRLFRFVVYAIDGKIRSGALKRKGRLLQEITIFVNLPEDHRKIYDAVVPIVSNAVKRGELREYVAMHVLLLAATSIGALLQLLCRGLKDNRVAKSFKELHSVIQDCVKDSISCAKLEIAVSLCDFTAKSKGKLVIFSAIPQVQEELVSAIKARGCSSEVFVCDLSSSGIDRREQVHKFNGTGSQGAVLLAPIGSTLDCVEEAGWGMINASHVLILDGIWKYSTIAQGINRVYGFAANTEVYVYHLLSVDTVECTLNAEMANRGSPSILLPQVSEFMFERRPIVSDEPLKPGEGDEWISTLRGLSAFHHAERSSRYGMSSASDADGTASEVDDYTAEECLALERNDYFRSLPAVIDSVQELSYGTNLYETLRNTRAYRAHNILGGKSSEPSDSFLPSWNEYFRLYEQSDDIENITEPLEAEVNDHGLDVHLAAESRLTTPTAVANNNRDDNSRKRNRPEHAAAESSVFHPSKRRIA